jgi:hypothetical protein
MVLSAVESPQGDEDVFGGVIATVFAAPSKSRSSRISSSWRSTA